MNSSLATENRVHVLLAVWGERFIDDFLQFGLLSLLAEGNLPALSKVYQTKFIFLTRVDEFSLFKQHLAYKKLETLCDIDFIDIMDLIVGSNHSSTLTFAYDRAIRAAGNEMLNTYFILLTSDYIMANGSFEGLVRYMQKGYSGICAGNFQMMEEIKPFLKRYFYPIDHSIRISPRVLLEESFKYLHAMTLASFYLDQFIHNDDANRFFFRHGNHILVGRFYLLHALCIKPETINYQVGASFDYSFIPEMCPSGNIAIIDDSDDYFVIEMQPQDSQLKTIHFGPYEIKPLVKKLAEWTTDLHRQNAQCAIYYHTEDISPKTKEELKAKSDQFIHDITLKLKKYKAQPYRDHPYWQGAVGAFYLAKHIIQNDPSDYRDFSSLDQYNKWRHVFRSIFGYPPYVNRFHYRWLEYQSTKDVIQKFVSSKHPESIVAFFGHSNDLEFMGYCGWLKRDFSIRNHYSIFMLEKENSSQLKANQFERCIFFVNLQDMAKIRKFYDMIRSVLTPSGVMLVYVTNPTRNQPAFFSNFLKDFSSQFHHLNLPDFRIIDVSTINNNFTFYGCYANSWITNILEHNKILGYFLYGLIGLPGLILTFIRNGLIRRSVSKKSFCTGILIQFASMGLQEERS